jgi:hypothetical protein
MKYDHVLLMKRGYFYRENAAGYTACRGEAGRYDRTDAEAHAANCEGVTVHEIAAINPEETK